MTRVVQSAAVAGLLIGAACGDATGPKFLTLPASFRTALCVRGNVTRHQSVNGSLANTDCDGGSQYYETYQVKVGADGSPDILLTSAVFDTYLDLYTVDSVVGDQVYGSPVSSDDDSGGGTNSLISGVTLLASQNYLLTVEGLDYTQTGAYTLSIK